jgi:hypothetical protein
MSDDYSSTNKARYGFGDYHTYEEIIKWMNDIERFYPQMAQTFNIGQTHENRPIKGIKVDKNNNSSSDCFHKIY